MDADIFFSVCSLILVFAFIIKRNNFAQSRQWFVHRPCLRLCIMRCQFIPGFFFLIFQNATNFWLLWLSCKNFNRKSSILLMEFHLLWKNLHEYIFSSLIWQTNKQTKNIKLKWKTIHKQLHINVYKLYIREEEKKNGKAIKIKVEILILFWFFDDFGFFFVWLKTSNVRLWFCVCFFLMQYFLLFIMVKCWFWFLH